MTVPKMRARSMPLALSRQGYCSAGMLVGSIQS